MLAKFQLAGPARLGSTDRTDRQTDRQARWLTGAPRRAHAIANWRLEGFQSEEVMATIATMSPEPGVGCELTTVVALDDRYARTAVSSMTSCGEAVPKKLRGGTVCGG